MWTVEQRQAASDRAKALWANPEYKKSQGDSIKKPPKCRRCGESSIEKFYLDKKGRRTNSVCKECHNIECKERWHARTPIEKQASRVLKRYNIAPEYYRSMHETQEGKCAICGEVPTTKHGLHVDHCHETGKVRALLCHGCNVALGSLKDSVELMTKAIEYINKHKSAHTNF